jgi:aryl-alcohol dehydrogenase-like predicted oxidoreductase
MIPTQPFGLTGHDSTRIIFGAAALGHVSQDDADRTLDVILRHGINHIDTAASYGDSELRIGPWMAEHRSKFFLATKTGERSYAAARDQIRRSLERLRVSQVDLIQLHNLAQSDEWEIAMGTDGALRACVEAREERLVRFVGVTGHGTIIPRMHLRSLERFAFDSVLLPYNFTMMQNAQYAADFEALASLCGQRNVAMQTIKSITRAPWGEREHTAATWYEPFVDQPDIDQAVHWVLGRPGIFLNTVGDVHVLPKVLDAASRFQSRPADAAMVRLVETRHMAPLFV